MKPLAILASLLLFASATAQAADPAVKGLTVNPTGAFNFHGVDFLLQHNDASWRSTRQSAAQVETSDKSNYKGTIPLPDGGSLSFDQTITPIDAESFTAPTSSRCLRRSPPRSSAWPSTSPPPKPRARPSAWTVSP